MSEEGGATTTPAPWVLDVSVLTAIARADPEVTYLVIALDGRGRPLIIPVLAITAASSDAGTEDGDIALRGLERLENVGARHGCSSPVLYRGGGHGDRRQGLRRRALRTRLTLMTGWS